MTPPAASFPPERSLGFVVNQLARLLAARLHERIQHLGVTPGQFAPLLVLLERGELTQRALRDLVDIEQPTLTRTLQRMERDGLIERREHPTDRRKTLVRPSERATSMRDDLVRSATDVNDLATAGLAPRQLEQLVAGLHQMIASLRDSTHPTG